MTDHDDDEATAKVEPETVEAPAVEAATVEAPRAPATVEAPIEPATVESGAKEIDDSEAVDEALPVEEALPVDEVAANEVAEDGVAPDEAAEAESAAEDESEKPEASPDKRNIEWSRVFAYIVLPALVLAVALAAAAFRFVDSSVRDADVAGAEAVQAARDTTVAILSYKPETVEKQLTDARGLLTGKFLESYTELTTKLVIPGAKQQQISAAANVPEVALVSAKPDHVVALAYVNQTVTIGGGTPSETASSVRLTLDKIDGKWLVSTFDPV